MKTKCYPIVLSILCVFAASAQYQLSGIVIEKDDGAPIPFATVALLHPDSSAITGVMTVDEGKFVIEKVAAGDYIVRASFIGYETVYRNVKVPEQSDLGEIMLAENANMLSEVVVTGRRALVVQQLDRTVVNVSGNIITSGLNMQDLLKQMPGLIVDESGSIRLNGRPATVYIDGRPTRLPAEQIAQLLNGMQGDAVDRVELIDNPSSRYEAGLSAAIVNIRLKRDASLGVNGSVQAGAGFTDYHFYTRDGLNLNYRSKKVNIFGNYGYNRAKDYSEIWQTRNYDDVTPISFDQFSLDRPVSSGHTLRGGFDVFVSPRHTVGFLFTGALNDRDGGIASKADIARTGAANIDSVVLSDAKYTNRFTSEMYNLNYRFDISGGEELTVDADYGSVNARNWQDIKSRYMKADGDELRMPVEFQYNGQRDIAILSVKADYVKPFSEKSRMEAGVKTGRTVTDNEILYENRYNGGWVDDPNLSNRFNYSEDVSAGYATYSHKAGKLSAMAGLRAEYTKVKGESVTMDTTFSRGYLDWFPSGYLQYKINDKQALNLSYSRKINRPGYSYLNPFRSFFDPFTFGSGNPDLQPEYRNTLALRYSIGGYSINASYSVVNDVIEKEFIQDNANRNIHITYNNIGKREAFAINVFAPVKIAKWYTLNTYAQTSWNRVDARYNGDQIKKDYLDSYVGMQHVFTILPTLRANMQMAWMPPSWQGLVARLDGFWTVNGQIEKTFFDRRLSMSLSCNDLFGTSIFIGKIKYGNIDQDFKEDYHHRKTLLTLRYNFGSQQIRGARNRSVGIEEEMGRTN